MILLVLWSLITKKKKTMGVSWRKVQYLIDLMDNMASIFISALFGLFPSLLFNNSFRSVEIARQFIIPSKISLDK